MYPQAGLNSSTYYPTLGLCFYTVAVMQTPHRDQDVELRDSTKILDTAYVSDVDPPRHVVDGGTRAWSSVVGGYDPVVRSVSLSSC